MSAEYELKSKIVSNQTMDRILFTGGVIATAATICISTIYPNTDVAEKQKKIDEPKQFSSKFNMQHNYGYSESGRVFHIEYAHDAVNNLYIYKEKEFDSEKFFISSNVILNTGKQAHIPTTDHIISREINKEVNAMEQEIYNHREIIEKFASKFGFALGTAILIPSLLSFIEWSATVPAATLFYSLTVFMVLRKKQRGNSHGI